MWSHPAEWIWILIPLAAIGLAPFKMWLRVKEKQIASQSELAAEKSAQYRAAAKRPARPITQARERGLTA